MNWIKRAFRSISYHKKNTILMFLSFLILSILILFGLCIRAASRERIWEIRTSIGGSVLVSNERQIYSEEPRGVNSISHQKYLELCADERIRFGSCNTVTAALADNFTAEIMDGQEENGTENIYVEGSSDPVEYFSSVSISNCSFKVPPAFVNANNSFSVIEKYTYISPISDTVVSG